MSWSTAAYTPGMLSTLISAAPETLDQNNPRAAVTPAKELAFMSRPQKKKAKGNQVYSKRRPTTVGSA
jgi:hypothetical protein